MILQNKMSKQVNSISEKTETPPRTRLILRVGVTGHRSNNLQKMNLDALRHQLSYIFGRLKSIVDVSREKSAGAYTGETPLLRIISPLADGADQIVASEAMKHEFELQCPLPFLQRSSNFEHYPEMLKDATAVVELDGSLEKKEQAYEAAGRMVLRQCDVLIAVWDKDEARGIGGTAQIVEEARQLWIPTIWINSVEPHEVTLLIPNDDGDWDSMDLGRLQTFLLPELVPPAEKKEKTNHHDVGPDLREAYFTEKIPGFSIAVLWKFFHKLLSHGRVWIPKKQKEEPKWSVEINSWSDLSKDARTQLTKVVDRIEAKLRLHYKFADALANHYSNLYYSGFIWNYLMSGFAVLFAFLAFGLKKYSWSFAELFAITSIVLVYISDKKGRWYDRRIDYRLLAELIRQTSFLGTIGRVPPLSPPQPIHSHYGDPSGSWIYWHFQSIVKQLGMVESKFSPDYLRAVGRLIKHETDQQVAYHERKSSENFKIDHRLHKLAVFMFALAALGCLLHVAEPKIASWAYIGSFIHHHEDFIKVALPFMSIVSPAFGAAFAGIRSQGEFERVARHSVAMAEYLREKSEELDKIHHLTHLNSNVLARIVDDIAEKMIEEMLDWRIVFHKRPIELA